MKILFFSHAFHPQIGGIESISMMVANYFSKVKGADVILVTNTKLTSTEADYPFRVIRKPDILKIIKLMFWCDVIFENNPCNRFSWPNFFVRKPNVVVLQTWITGPQDKFNIYKWIKKQMLHNYNFVIAISEKIKNFTFKNALIVANPYDSSVYCNNKVPVNDFVFLGRLVSDKGADMCIELLHHLNARKDEKFNLTIIGDGPELIHLKTLSKKFQLNTHVRYTGFLSPKAILSELNNHRYILVPSRWEEPFGIVALEGMACGCIPIVSDGGGLPDAVGNAGVIFERNNLKDLVNKTVALLGNEPKQIELKNKAKQHLANHTEERIGKRYYAVIKKALE